MTDQPITVDTMVPVSVPFSAVRTWPPYRTYLVALLMLFVAKQAFTVVIFPPFTGHDEVVHYAYIRTVADEHRVPVIPELEEWRIAWAEREEPPGDYIPTDLYAYQRYVLDWCCNPDDNPQYATTPPGGMNLGGLIFPNGWQYAANHPPLYYLLMSPIYVASDWASPVAQQYVIRAAAIPIGIAIIVLTYLIAGLIFPRDRFMLAVAPTFVAFQTQFSYESAMVNNDILLVGMFTLLVYLLVRGVMTSFTPGSAAVIGLVLGLGLLTKASMLSAAPLVAFAMVLGIGIVQVKRWVALGAISGLVAGLVAFPWYLFLYRTYGNLTALEQVKALQYSWTYRGRTPPSIPDLLFNADFAKWRWRETWGEFGWRLIHVEGLLSAGDRFTAAAHGALWAGHPDRPDRPAYGRFNSWRAPGPESGNCALASGAGRRGCVFCDAPIWHDLPADPGTVLFQCDRCGGGDPRFRIPAGTSDSISTGRGRSVSGLHGRHQCDDLQPIRSAILVSGVMMNRTDYAPRPQDGFGESRPWLLHDGKRCSAGGDVPWRRGSDSHWNR